MIEVEDRAERAALSKAMSVGLTDELDRVLSATLSKARAFRAYQRKQIAELRPYVPGESLDGISVSHADELSGSPKPGDMIARNPKNHADQWLVAKQYFEDNFEALP
jgi:hypothetical protein